ncbi:hypothetical protein BC827DRAFT_1270922 [Russula dissimulans]|nr:hypothetical protein BC827DRAFT_1270922 [Russula dissimulans]
MEEEGEEADEPEEEEEDEEPTNDRDGDAVEETTPSHSSRLKITLKLPTQTQNLKPSRAPNAVQKNKDLTTTSNRKTTANTTIPVAGMESGRSRHVGRVLERRWVLHVSLGGFMFLILSRLLIRSLGQ